MKRNGNIGRNGMKRPESPCLDCTDRHESCHATCDKYIAYAEDMAAYRETVKIARLKDYERAITDQKRYYRKRRKGE